MGLEDETHFVDTSWNPRTLGRGEKVFWKFWYLENYAILNPTQLESSYWSCSQGTKILRMLFSDTNVMIEVPQFVQKKNSFWGVFLFLAGGNANFMWRPNSFRFQALHPSIFRTAANLPIIIIKNGQGLSRKMTFWDRWNLFVVAHPAWWLTVFIRYSVTWEAAEWPAGRSHLRSGMKSNDY